MDKLILVLYVDVGYSDDVDLINQQVKNIGETLFTEDVIKKTKATTFVIPVRGGGTRIECINPKFIVDKDVMRDHQLKIDVLNENLDYFIKQKKYD